MKFGIVKTKVEEKLIKSFKDNTLKENLSFFKKNILSDKDFCKMMSIYDNLHENKNVDKETAIFIVDDLVSEFKKTKLKESTLKNILNWTKDTENRSDYMTLDNLMYLGINETEEKSKSKKTIVENLTKKKGEPKKEPKLPISVILNVANQKAKEFLQTLDESDRTKVLEIIKMDDKELTDKFEKLKETTITNIDKLIGESEGDLKKTLVDTKNKISESTVNKKEFIKLLDLNKSLL
jgi:hypothetical protein